jgi:exosortase E/protease (VPEID-CTERM system)
MTPVNTLSGTSSPGTGLYARLGVLAAIFTAELLAITTWLDTSALLGRHGLVALVGDWGPWLVKLTIASVAAFLILGESRQMTGATGDIDSDLRDAIDWRLLLGHAAAMAAVVALSSVVFAKGADGLLSNVEVLAWIATGLAAIALAACALIPARIWIAKIREMRDLLIFAPAAGLAGCILGSFANKFWKPLSSGTMTLASIMLRPFLAHVVANRTTLTLGSDKFNVSIAPACSGYEGIGLVLAVTCAWLWFLRKQWRFPNALALIPIGVAAVWTLNAARIAALILIGNTGAEQIALGGFHSQAGWIGFSLVALGVCAAARRIAWFNVQAEPTHLTTASAGPNPVAVYLMPFLAILAAGLIARAASADFEWFYGLRVIAAVGALWYFRRSYRNLDWRFGPAALGLGAVVCAMWIALDRFTSITPVAAPVAFAHATFSARSAWIALRLIGAVITVPIAEELAFRGFLLRRLAGTDFESVSSKAFSWMPFLVSSIAFGILHGDRWLAGAIAGMCYAFAMQRRGRLGDAIAAHGFTNLLLAVWVLFTGNWQFW